MQWMKRVFGETVRRQQETPDVQPTLIMALEPRMMFDGAVAASVGEAAKPTDTQDAVADKGAAATHSKDSDSSHAAATGDVRSSDAGQGAQAGSGRNVVFVDSRVEDAKQLLQGVASNTDVVFLDRNGNGVQQMAQYLAAHPGAASVQIIAHGNAGDLWLGNSYVSAENIADYGASLNQLGANMQAGGDILVYACSTAQGERGQTFVDELASLTGRDVAASNDRTGAGSDWDLEVTTGNIEARSVLSQASEAAYGHDLAIITVTSNADSGAGTLRNAIASAQAGDTITFSSAMTVNLSSGQLSIGKSLTIEGDIDGNGTADVTIDAHQTSRVLVITTGTVKLDGLVLTGGLLSGNGGDYNSVNGKDALGAGLAVTGGTVTLTHSSVTANAAAGGGGNGGGAGYGYGGGGGGGFNGVGGARGGNYSPAYAGQSGGSGVGGRGGFYVGISNGVNYVGKGGNTSGGTGGAANTGFAAGGSGGRAGSAGSGYIGGGGAGSGASLAASVGTGGNAAGGIYIASGATLYVATTSITKNLGAGGGGAGSSYSVAGANGGIGVGGILNKGTLHYDSTSVNLLSGQQNYGQGGAGGGAQHGQATGSAGSGTNTGNENLTTAGAGTVDSSWSPDIAPTNTTSGGTTAFIEGNNTVSTPVVVDSGFTVSDPDNTSLASATVSVTGNFHSAEDVLSFTNNGSTMGNIVGSYNSATGVLTLTSAGGSATLAQWQTALRAVTYSDTSDTPDTGNRTVSFTVNDGSSDSAVTSKTLTVASTDDTPVVTTSGGTTAFVEGNNATSTPVVVDSGITVNDLDNPTLSSATVAITGNFHSAEDVLAFSNDGSTMGDIVGSYNAATGLLTLTSAGSATLAQWQAALRAVTYTNSSESPNTATRTLSFAANDGTATGNAATRTVGVTSVDDTPIATASGGATAASENLPAVIDAGLVLSDLDNTTLASATVSITSNFHIGEDVLAFSNDGSTMGNILASYNATTGVLTLTSASASATLAQWQAALRSVTYTDTADAPNTADRSVSFAVNDGTTNSLAATKTVSVTAVNDAPLVTASGGSAAFVAGDNSVSTPVAIDSGITLSDPDNTTLASATVAITGNFHSGEDVLSFTNNGSTMGNITASYNAATGILTLTSASASATLAQWQAALRSVTYTDTAITPNTSTRTISFTVNDGAADSVATSRTVTVAATDQTPILATSGGTSAFTEGDNVASTPVVIDAGLTVSDLDNLTLSSATVSITGNFNSGEDVLAFSNDGSTMGNIVASYNAGTGVLTLTSSGGQATLAQWQAALRAVTYGNASDTPSTASRVVSFSVSDGSKTSAAATRTVSVTAVDDAPVLTASGGTAAVTEANNTASTPVVIDGGLTVSDLDNGTLASATVAVTGNFQSGEDVLSFTNNGSTMGNIVGSYNAATGILTLTSAGANATLAQWQAALRAVTYTDTSDSPNTGNRSIGFSVNDGSKDSAPVTRTVSVTAVNDTPVLGVDSGSAAFVAGDNTASTPVAIDSGITISDLDNTSLASATISITGNFHPGEDVLSFVNDGSTMGNIAASFNAATGVLTLTSAGASATLAQWQAALRSVTYTDTAVTPNTATRTVSFQVNDGTDGSNVGTRTITVSAVDQTPIVTAGSGSSVFTKGGAPVAIDSGITVSDLDNTTLATATVAITGNFHSGEDLLAFTNSNSALFGNIVASYNVGTGVMTLSSAGATATLAQWQNALEAVTYSNGSSTPNAATRTISFAVNDGSKTSAAATHAVDVLVNPSVLSVSATTANGAYKVGDTISITVTFDQAVNVDTSGGSPTLLLETGATDRTATYQSGNGTNTLIFTYTVQAGDQSADLDFASTSALSLNGATIRNATSDDAILTLASPGAAGSLGANKAIVIDGVAPTVSSVSVPANGTYPAGGNLDFIVNYSENVTVDTSGGTPYIDVTLDTGGTVRAQYLAGSGTSALTFRLVLASGQVDSNGVSLGSSVQLNGGALRDLAGNAAVTTLNSVGSTAGVLVDGVAPTPSGIARVEAASNNATSLHYTVTFDEAVSGVDASDFTLVGTGTAAGSISSVTQIDARTYTVLIGSVSGDGTLRLDLNASGTGITDLAGNPVSGGLQGGVYTLDHTAPDVTSVAVPSNGYYRAGDLLSFTVNASEAVTVDTSGATPRLALTIGSRTVYANYVSGSGSTALVFQYQVQAGDNDADGITVGALQTNGGSLRDAVGNDAVTTLNSVGSTAAVLVDTTVPTVASVSVPAAGDYKAGALLDFTVNASEAITLNTLGGVPRLALDIGGRTVYANYVSGSGTSALVFQYQVQAGDNDADGIAVLGLDANGGSLHDVAGNALALGLNNVADPSGVQVDTRAPQVSSVTAIAAGDYKAGQVLTFTVDTDEPITLDTSGGAPRLALDIGGRTVYADYVSGSATTLQFQYQIQPGDNDADGIQILSLQSNGSTLRDAAGNDLQAGLRNVRDTSSVLVDTTAPTATTLVRANPSPSNAGTVDFDVSFSERVDGLAATSFTLQATGTASGQILSVTRLNDQTWRVTVGNVGGDGNLTLSLRADNQVQDRAGNSLQQGLQGPAYALDHSSPQVNGVQVPADGRYSVGQSLKFTVGYNEAVVVDTSGGVPRIAITLAQGGTAYANYVSGSGTQQLVFAYTVQAGQTDNDGIQLGDQILTNGGRLSDAVGNAASLQLGALPSTAGVLVQGSLSDGDPQFRTDQGTRPVVIVNSGSPSNGPFVPSPLQHAGPPVLGMPPLLDSSNLGQAQSAFTSLFREAPSQSQFALIFSNASSSGHGDGAGMGFLGFGGGDAGVFATSSLSSVFDAAQQGTDEALSAFDHRGGNVFGGLHGAFATPGLGQQLHEMNQREQRQVADLAKALGELGQERPAS
ncbi:hypothetical protein PKB_3101 [Pseudomonas knackmussii B13]|uniref:DUF4347 domain-containing protein n=1 Tax=Pseudomonas knackmussii (strain DSM 6978 / CCUG 54928 / LMG 23759 / B13) TaxID=1301098 RepID=A0A024HJ11_PSEKB|nr:DUF4347 domain-containing protein [Pseudomonas knackmussii]CDF84448.1 hypothetical protein PKB_3101 [Pseudomonas knackmussii B13]